QDGLGIHPREVRERTFGVGNKIAQFSNVDKKNAIVALKVAIREKFAFRDGESVFAAFGEKSFAQNFERLGIFARQGLRLSGIAKRNALAGADDLVVGLIKSALAGRLLPGMNRMLPNVRHKLDHPERQEPAKRD